MTKGWMGPVMSAMRLSAFGVLAGLVLGTGLMGQAPVPDTAGVYSMGKGVVAPKIVFQVEPEFTEAARKKKISGDCRVEFVVDASGHVGEVKVARSVGEGQEEKVRKAAASLDAKAVEAVRQYRFLPGTVEGKAVPVRMTVEINFQIY